MQLYLRESMGGIKGHALLINIYIIYSLVFATIILVNFIILRHRP